MCAKTFVKERAVAKCNVVILRQLNLLDGNSCKVSHRDEWQIGVVLKCIEIC